MTSVPAIMTPAQLALITGEHVGSIRRGIREGRIPADKVNGRLYISRDAVFPNAMKSKEVEKGVSEEEGV